MHSLRLNDQIRAGLSSLELRRIKETYTRQAAVLIPILEHQGEPCFLLTRRTEEVKTHKGQLSFPGGMRQANESLENTALRETFEEVGIEPDKIEVLGRFHEYLSVTGYCVTPFAGFVSAPFVAVPQAREVAEILLVPLHVFRDPGKLRVERRVRLGQLRNVYFYSYGRHEIWGLTARIIRDFLENLNTIF